MLHVGMAFLAVLREWPLAEGERRIDGDAGLEAIAAHGAAGHEAPACSAANAAVRRVAPRAVLAPHVPRWLSRGSRIAFGRNVQLRRNSQADSRVLFAALAPDFRTNASRVCCAGVPARRDKQRFVMLGGHVVAGPKVSTWHSRRDTDRASFSHVIAQASGLARSIAGGETSVLGSTNLLDDASMWLRKPREALPSDLAAAAHGGVVGPGVSLPQEGDVAAELNPIPTFLQKRMDQRGPDVHLPVLSVVEHVFHQRQFAGGETAFGGAEVHSPSIPLARANTATVYDRWKKWSAITSSGTGAFISGNSLVNNLLTSRVEAVPWRLTMMIRDNLLLNSCVQCLEERELSRRFCMTLPAERQQTLLTINCARHSCVLSSRPILESVARLSSTLVTVVHNLESSRQHSLFAKPLKSLLDEPGAFVYREVSELPASCIRWRAHNQRVLELSRSMRDQSAAEECYILHIDNVIAFEAVVQESVVDRRRMRLALPNTSRWWILYVYARQLSKHTPGAIQAHRQAHARRTEWRNLGAFHGHRKVCALRE